MRGYGLFERLSDKIDYMANAPQGTSVRVEKRLHYETTGAANEAAAQETGTGGIMPVFKGDTIIS